MANIIDREAVIVVVEPAHGWSADDSIDTSAGSARRNE